MQGDLEDLYQEALAAYREKQWRRDNPYVADLIEVLWLHGIAGLARRRALEALKRMRDTKGLPVPQTFEEAAQSAFNQHCLQSTVLQKRGNPDDGLFSSRRSGRSANWLVHHERAAA